jgi:hypothetical protein
MVVFNPKLISYLGDFGDFFLLKIAQIRPSQQKKLPRTLKIAQIAKFRPLWSPCSQDSQTPNSQTLLTQKEPFKLPAIGICESTQALEGRPGFFEMTKKCFFSRAFKINLGL